MTNKEKFKEVFGFSLNESAIGVCPAPKTVCKQMRYNQECPFRDWWDKEYKPCFKLREDFE